MLYLPPPHSSPLLPPRDQGVFRDLEMAIQATITAGLVWNAWADTRVTCVEQPRFWAAQRRWHVDFGAWLGSLMSPTFRYRTINVIVNLLNEQDMISLAISDWCQKKRNERRNERTNKCRDQRYVSLNPNCTYQRSSMIYSTHCRIESCNICLLIPSNFLFKKLLITSSNKSDKIKFIELIECLVFQVRIVPICVGIDIDHSKEFIICN
jgi:hypothetical protein